MTARRHGMRILSWNVNGVRAVWKKGFEVFVAKQKPDILCIQETKAAAEVEPPIAGYRSWWNHADRPGYAGTAVYSRIEPVNVTRGIGIAKHDREGRVLTLELDDLFIVNAYVPNSKRDLTRLPYRYKEWDPDLLRYLKKLERGKPVVLCGDLNVAHQEIDLANPKANVKNHGFTPEERAGFDALLRAGFIDTFRLFEGGGGHYTWWSGLGDCRARNVGWRIDYFLASKSLKQRIKRAFILKDVQGSDHCPVGIELSRGSG